jgi:hypothetical protein
MLQFELFALVPVEPSRLWALVGDVARLPEWTDATAVEGAPEAPGVGDRFATLEGSRILRWTVITSENRLLEAKTDTACGRLGIGVSVRSDGEGSRLVLAGLLDPSMPGWRARLVEVPRLRRRFDAWSARALRAAISGRGPHS